MSTYSRAEAADRAGVGVELVARMVELGILKPTEGDRFTPGDARRAEMVQSLEKAGIPMEGLAARIHELLDAVQKNLFERAVAFTDDHTQRVKTYDEFKAAMEGRPGFVIAPWCGAADCEAQIKADTQATIRNMPLGGAAASGGCVRCDRPAQTEAWFAKAY